MDNYYIYDANGVHNNSYADEAMLYDSYNRITGDIFNDMNKQEAGMKLWFAYNKLLNSNNKIWNGMFEQPLHNADVKSELPSLQGGASGKAKERD